MLMPGVGLVGEFGVQQMTKDNLGASKNESQ